MLHFANLAFHPQAEAGVFQVTPPLSLSLLLESGIKSF